MGVLLIWFPTVNQIVVDNFCRLGGEYNRGLWAELADRVTCHEEVRIRDEF